MYTHLLEWLPDGYTHCKHGSKEWCDGYLNNAVDTIRELQARPAVPDVDELAQIIRRVDGGNMLGAGELAERIIAALLTR